MSLFWHFFYHPLVTKTKTAIFQPLPFFNPVELSLRFYCKHFHASHKLNIYNRIHRDKFLKRCFNKQNKKQVRKQMKN